MTTRSELPMNPTEIRPSISRALNLNLSREQVVKHCGSRDVGISAMEDLPDGGVRLVCMSVGGAESLRADLHRHVIKGDARRTPLRERRAPW